MKLTKRIVSLLLCAVMVLGSVAAGGEGVADVLSTVAFADDAATSGTCGDNLTWSFADGTLTISGTGKMTDYKLGGTPWYSFTYKTTNIDIENGVTSIGDVAFEYFDITDIAIPDSVTSIGDYAFSHTDLTDVKIPDSVTSIGDYAFFECSYLEKVKIGSKVESIGNLAFAYCHSLTSMTVSEGNEFYNSGNGCNAIIETATNTLIAGCKNTVIPGSVTSIGDYAFYGCILYGDCITSIEIPSSVTSIGKEAFFECSGLKDVDLSNVTSIGTYAFGSCTSFTGITIPGSVENISSGAFKSCTGAENLTISEGVRSIGGFAFAGCASLTTITIPDGVESIDATAFNQCSSVTDITVDENNKVYDSRNNCNAIIETATNTLIAGCKNTVIPGTVTSIGNDAFYGHSGLTDIAIPGSVTSIGKEAFTGTGYYNEDSNWENDVLYLGNRLLKAKSTVSGKYDIKQGTAQIADSAFEYCRELTGITIPGSVTSISDNAFYYCTSLTDVNLSGVTSIGERAFNGCSALTDIDLNGVTSIGDEAFCGSGLTEINIPGSITSIGKGVFGDYEGLEKITVDENNTVYDSRDNCNAIIETATNTLIAGCKNTVIPGSVTGVGEWAFYCPGLTEITIPAGVTNIDECAFLGCVDLVKITVDENNTVYDSRNNCNAIIETATNTLIAGCKDTVIPGSVTSIGSYAFYGCTSLTGITIPDGVTSIGNYAFSSCTGLTEITVPDGVTSIGDGAFMGCLYLEKITIPKSVTTIGTYAFLFADLTDVYYTGSEEDRGNISISPVPFVSGAAPGNFLLDEATWHYNYKPDHTHSYTSEVTTQPTCTAAGVTTYTCSCGNTYTETIDKLGHSFTNYVSDNNAACTADGTETAKCDRCDVTDTRVIENSAPGHKDTDGDGKCDACGLQLSAQYTITYIVNGTEICTDSYPAGADVIWFADPEREGCTFTGWDTDGDGVVDDLPEKMPAYNITATAMWSAIQYTIKFVDTDGFEFGSFTADFGAAITAPADPTSSYRTFKGWSSEIPATMPACDMTIVAVWEVNKYNITYDANGGAWADGDTSKIITGVYGDAIEPCATLPEKDGCTFMGWDTDGDGVVDDLPEKMPDHDITLHAVWEPMSYSLIVNYVFEDGTQAAPQWKLNVNYGLAYSVASPEIDGYTPDYETITGTMDCGDVEVTVTYTKDQTPPSHECDYEVTKKNATCTENGQLTYTCKICGKTYTEVIEKTGHTPMDVEVPSTCKVPGMNYQICSCCGETIGDATVLPLAEHTFGEWQTTKEATCTVNGESTRSCSVCGKSETKVIEAKGHTPGEWVVETEATIEHSGKRVQYCTVCHKALNEEIIEKIPSVTVEDKSSGITLEYPDTYEENVELSIEKTFDGASFNLVNKSTNAAESVIYDIKMLVGGAETQPDSTVIVRIPLPAGYDPLKTFVYHVNSATGKVENMKASYENGFMVFATNHFSYYAVVEENPTANSIINVASEKKIDYRSKVIITATASNVPSDYYLAVYVNGKQVAKGSNTEVNYTIDRLDGDVNYTVKIVDVNNNVQKDASGNDLSKDGGKITCNAGFFKKLIAFFKGLFGSLPTVTVKP